jgi:hypothetical protein
MKVILSKVLITLVFLTSCGNEESRNASKADMAISQVEAEKIEKDVMNRKNILNGMLSVLIPEDFTLMTNEEKQLKYPGQNAPQEVWANKDRDINISFSNTNQPLPESELDVYINQVAEGVRKNMSGSRWYGMNTKTFNGLRAGVLEFESPVQDGNIYNLMCFACVKGKLIVYSFNCLAKDKEKLSRIGKQIIESVK